MVTFELFVRPALRALQGLPPHVTPLPARTAVALASRPAAVTSSAPPSLSETERSGPPRCRNQSSGALSSATGATHLISLDPDTTDLEIGSEINLIPVDWRGVVRR